MKTNYWESYFLSLIREKRKGVIAKFLKTVLRILSWAFQFAVVVRNWAFDQGWLRRYYPPVPLVISIGNIVAGGTGKTPVTLMLAREFYSDFMIAILSRGYRSPAESLASPVWLSKGEGPMHPAAYSGDEPYLLSQNLPRALVFVGKDRHKASNMAAKAGAHLILLDDGMQHRRLARDLEVIVMDASDPFGSGYFLPRGFLREGKKSLSRASLVILNHVRDRESHELMKKQIAHYTAAPIIGTKMEVEGVYDFAGYQTESLDGKRVGLFCGIAHPEYFYETVRSQGAQVVASHIVADHMLFDISNLEKFAQSCLDKNVDFLVCTEKDKVKFGGSIKLPLPAAWIKMRLNILEGESEWRTFIHSAKKDLLRRV